MSPIDFPQIYNPGNQTREELIDNFVVRRELFQEIFDDLATSKMKYPEQHYIIQGVRGQGKTTLLLRIAYEILNDKKLCKNMVPIIFNEEQYNISRLFKLWETIAEYLEEKNERRGLYHKMQKFQDAPDYERQCFELLEKEVIRRKRKLILFIDNIDDMLNKFSVREHQRLREIFTDSAEIRIIGASSGSLEFHYDYGHSFYQFFKMPQLRGLSNKETKTLLLKLGQHYKRDRVKDIVENQPGRVEVLRRLTGGVIRTIIFLYGIFVDDNHGNAFKDLEKILDSATPLYKQRMDNLSPQQQEIVDFIALSWDAVGTKEISQKTKLPSKTISAQIKQLGRYHIIDKIETNTKNLMYRISERFFNIWYLMRHGRKWDEKRVRFLVEFLHIWCDPKELENRTRIHLTAIRSGILYEKHALYMTEALARTTIHRDLQHELLSETRSYLNNKGMEIEDLISLSDRDLSEEGKIAALSGNIDTAIDNLEKIRIKSIEEITILATLYAATGQKIQIAEKYLLAGVEKEHPDAMLNLANLYISEMKDTEKAERYYLMAVEKQHPLAMFNLARLYQTKFKDFKKAERYYLMAVEKEHPDAMNNLAWLFFEMRKEKEKALEFAERAYANGKNLHNAHSLSTILLWNNEIQRALDTAHVFLEAEDAFEVFPDDIILFFILLMAKKQYHSVLKIFQENPHHLKDRFKPVYYALMFFLTDEFPNEFKKMGGELEETVNEIIEKIAQVEKNYA